MADNNDKLSLHIASKDFVTTSSGFRDNSGNSGLPLSNIGGSGHGGGPPGLIYVNWKTTGKPGNTWTWYHVYYDDGSYYGDARADDKYV